MSTALCLVLEAAALPWWGGELPWAWDGDSDEMAMTVMPLCSTSCAPSTVPSVVPGFVLTYLIISSHFRD